MTKEEIYDERISPLMTQIIDICKEHKIALLANFCLSLEDDGLMATSSLLTNEYEPSDSQLKALKILYPPKHIALAETIETWPDGSKKITISRIS